MVFEGMEESGSEGLDDLLMKLKNEGWMKVRQYFYFYLVTLGLCSFCMFFSVFS